LKSQKALGLISALYKNFNKFLAINIKPKEKKSYIGAPMRRGLWPMQMSEGAWRCVNKPL
jgi:hypothetical protein